MKRRGFLLSSIAFGAFGAATVMHSEPAHAKDASDRIAEQFRDGKIIRQNGWVISEIESLQAPGNHVSR